MDFAFCTWFLTFPLNPVCYILEVFSDYCISEYYYVQVPHLKDRVQFILPDTNPQIPSEKIHFFYSSQSCNTEKNSKSYTKA